MAIGVGQLIAGIVAPDGSPVVAVGEASIDRTPPPVKNFAISAFGSNDKLVLVTGILAVLAVFAAIVGLLAMRKIWYGMAGLAVFTAIGATAALSRPTASASFVLPSLVGGAAAAVALVLLVRAAPPAAEPISPRTGTARSGLDGPHDLSPESLPPSSPGPRAPATPSGSSTWVDRWRPPAGPERRSFLKTGVVVAGTATVAGLGGRLLAEHSSVSRAQASLRIPVPAHPAPRCRPAAT